VEWYSNKYSGIVSIVSAYSVVRAYSEVSIVGAMGVVGAVSAVYARTTSCDNHFAHHVRPTEPPDLACRGLSHVKKSYAFNKTAS
jgi:hypothetical protein